MPKTTQWIIGAAGIALLIGVGLFALPLLAQGPDMGINTPLADAVLSCSEGPPAQRLVCVDASIDAVINNQDTEHTLVSEKLIFCRTRTNGMDERLMCYDIVAEGLRNARGEAAPLPEPMSQTEFEQALTQIYNQRLMADSHVFVAKTENYHETLQVKKFVVQDCQVAYITQNKRIYLKRGVTEDFITHFVVDLAQTEEFRVESHYDEHTGGKLVFAANGKNVFQSNHQIKVKTPEHDYICSSAYFRWERDGEMGNVCQTLYWYQNEHGFDLQRIQREMPGQRVWMGGGIPSNQRSKEILTVFAGELQKLRDGCRQNTQP